MSVAYPMLIDYHELLNPCSPQPNPLQMHLHHHIPPSLANHVGSPIGCLPSSWGSYESLFPHMGLPMPPVMQQHHHQEMQLGCVSPVFDIWKGEETPNHIILITILNPAYPITVDVVHTICQVYGNVARIVIFKKNGLQSMVEFESIENATRAKEGLQGADIYSGCCTLRIQFAKPSKLNVFKNDNESWDFTAPNLGEYPSRDGGMESKPSRPPLLQEPRGFGGMSHSSMRGSGGMNGLGSPRNQPGLFSAPLSDRYSHQDRYNEPMTTRLGMGGGMNGGGGGMRGGAGLAGAGPGVGAPLFGGQGPPSQSLSMMGQGPGHPYQGAVLMVYGLNKDKMNADKLFNLLCLYGNVVRVKFLKTKEGCAMVQMGDGSAVERSIENLNNTSFFDSKMQLAYSKQAFLADVHQPFDLPDGTPSFKDYMGNKYNRFINPEMASKNRIQPPSKILHFFNTPPNLSDEIISEVFGEHGVAPPKTFKVFPSKSERSSSGLLEFNDMSEALEALVCANHSSIANRTSKFPYVMKLCFSSSHRIQQPTKIKHDDEEEEEEEDRHMSD